MNCKYTYHGYLKRFLEIPEPAALENLDQVPFGPLELGSWVMRDDPAEKEWRSVPAKLRSVDGGVMLSGHFEEIRRIDNLDRSDPRYWAPLSVSHAEDGRFPLDCLRFPIVEITYRCVTARALPACQWQYPGGAHLFFLKPSREWQTAAMLIPQRGFPTSLVRFTLRLYSTLRSAESMEVSSIRFRAMLPEEATALEKIDREIRAVAPPRTYPVLDTFFPFGVYMDAGTASQQADMMDVTQTDYWRLALEDVVRHHHNCIILEGTHHLDTQEIKTILGLAKDFGLRVVPTFEWPMEDFESQGAALIEQYIKPHAASPAVLAWNVLDAPPEQTLNGFLKARDLLHDVDSIHPMAIHMRQGDALPLFARHFAVSGFSYFKSGAPWELGDAIRVHLPLAGGQHFWVTAPAFVYASDAPDWNTSPQMRLMLNLAMAQGARGWFSYTYHNTPIWADGQCQRSLTGPFLTFCDLWAELSNRIARLDALSPLFLAAHPVTPPNHLDFQAVAQRHPKSRMRDDIASVNTYWLEGPDFYLFHMVNNDTEQVTSVNLQIPEKLPDGLEIYDTTALARLRAWSATEHSRHFEMFPGQGQLLLIADPVVCARWRDTIAERILESDRRQALEDLKLAHAYRLNLEDIESILQGEDEGPLLPKLNRIHGARERLTNLIYATPEIYATRSLLIKVSSIICGCEEALGKYYGTGRVELARQLGVKIIPHARKLTSLRMRLRLGEGARIAEEAAILADQCMATLTEIWSAK